MALAERFENPECSYCGSRDDTRVCIKCGMVRAAIIFALTGDKERAKLEAVLSYSFCANCRVYHEDETKRNASNHK